MERAPIFIIGTERSGSNLLRLILNSHSGIAVPHPPHIVKFFSSLEQEYGDCTQPENFKKLVEDVLGLLDVHVYPWEMPLDPEKIRDGAPSKDVMGVFFSIYDSYQNHHGKRRWGCKSTFIIDHIPKVLALCPGAKFLFLVRDPRDVAASSRKSIFSPFHPYFTTKLWRRQQLEGLNFFDTQGRDSCYLLRYEDLIANPEQTVRNICDFLGEVYEPAMLEYYRTPAAQKSERLSDSWKNAGTPVISSNTNKFLKALSKNEIDIVEHLTGDLMHRFGYQARSPEVGKQVENSGRDLVIQDEQRCICWWYRLLNMYWAFKVELRSSCLDKNYWRFWRRRIYLFRLRLAFLLKSVGGKKIQGKHEGKSRLGF